MKKRAIFTLLFFVIVSYGQPLYSSIIGESFVEDATAKSNGFKVVNTESYSDLFAVYMYDSNTLKWAHSIDEGVVWENSTVLVPFGWSNPRYPSIDMHGDLPIIVYQADSAGISQIFIECPLDWGTPTQITFSENNSVCPAIIVDSSGAVHVVWQEDDEFSEIYYYTAPTYSDYGSSISENLSRTPTIYDRQPSISIFNTDEVYVMWESEDPPCDTPYSIRRRIKSGGSFLPVEALDGYWEPLGNVSLSYPQVFEHTPACAWESSDSLCFQPSNENWNTYATSNRPVLSITSDCFFYWEVDSAGYKDIYYNHTSNGASIQHFTYKFRDCISDATPRHPSANDCYAIWTEGDSSPYEVKFLYNGYMINIDETELPKEIKISAYPNPFNSVVSIVVPQSSKTIEIFDVTGKEILKKQDIGNTNTFVWQVESSTETGVYFIKVDTGESYITKRVIYLK